MNAVLTWYPQRQKEVNDKIHAAVREAFGERLDTMMYLDAVATEPESQGTGYGTVLMKFLADLVSLGIELPLSHFVTQFPICSPHSLTNLYGCIPPTPIVSVSINPEDSEV